MQRAAWFLLFVVVGCENASAPASPPTPSLPPVLPPPSAKSAPPSASTKSAPPSALTNPAPPAAASSSVGARPATNGCAALADEDRQVAAAKLTCARCRPGATPWKEPCLSSPEGAWAVTARPSPIAPHAALLELTHLSVDGARVSKPFKADAFDSLALATDETANCGRCEYSDPVLVPMAVYDFDHDGIAEVWVRQPKDEYSGVGANAIFTMKAGTIVPYAPAAGPTWFELRDVDDDGIPDLVYEERIGGGYDAGCGAPSPAIYSPPLVAHARTDGSFAFDDAVAEKAARAACPAPPAKPESATNLVDLFCARVWGVSTERLAPLQRAKDRCYEKNAVRDPAYQGCQPTGRSACPEETDRAELTRFTPRLVLAAH